MRLQRSFFARPTLEVARELLGMRLIRHVGGRSLSGRIVEVEAYIGEADSACHASKGKTPRNRIMFGPPGHAYVYFTYGMHWMLNVVTEEEGKPAALLLRALEPERGADQMRVYRLGSSDRDLASGPARLCQALRIDGSLNGIDLLSSNELFLEAGERIDPVAIATTPRIGIQYAERKDREAPWRFLIAGNAFVSRARPVDPRSLPSRATPRSRVEAGLVEKKAGRKRRNRPKTVG
jgi:DNA-3-methyladenine glycosylase